jgi:hypothetical protein
MSRFPLSSTLLLSFSLFLLSGCAHSCRGLRESPDSRDSSTKELRSDALRGEASDGGGAGASGVSLARSIELQGFVAEMALAGRTGEVLLSLIPDPEQRGRDRVRRPSLELRDAHGRRLWRRELKVQSRLISISEDSHWIAVQSHLEELSLWNREGRQAWARKASCKPIFLPASADLLLCHHDDTARPDVALELFRLSDGKKLAEYKQGSDPLAVRIFPDGRQVAVSFGGGALEILPLPRAAAELLRTRFEWRPLQRLSVEGEITDFGTDEDGLWVLHGRPQKISRWSRASGQWGTLALEEIYRQLDVAKSVGEVRGAWLYGNGQGSQRVKRVLLGNDGVPMASWTRSVQGASEYSSQVRNWNSSGGEGAVLGIEWPGEGSALVRIAEDGRPLGSHRVSEAGRVGLLYAFVREGKRLVAASDAGQLLYFGETPSAGAIGGAAQGPGAVPSRVKGER